MDSNTLVPLRWLPPECILYRRFTAESDIWSFGVLLWEIFSYGQIPWHAYANAEVLDVIESGRLLAQPERCPTEIYTNLITRCWATRPSDRITAHEICEILESYFDQATGYCNLSVPAGVERTITSTTTISLDGYDNGNTDTMTTTL
jgi:serine/threonine protein kinase